MVIADEPADFAAGRGDGPDPSVARSLRPIGGRRLGQARGMGMEIAYQLRTACPFSLVRGDQRGRIDLEMAQRIGGDIDGFARRVDPRAPAQQQAASLMRRGGTLAIAAEERDGSYEIAVRAEGTRIAFDKDVGRSLEGEIAMNDLSAHTAPAMLVRLIAQDCGGGVQHALTPDGATGGALVLGAILPRG